MPRSVLYSSNCNFSRQAGAEVYVIVGVVAVVFLVAIVALAWARFRRRTHSQVSLLILILFILIILCILILFVSIMFLSVCNLSILAGARSGHRLTKADSTQC